MTFYDSQALIAFLGGVSLGALLAVVTLPWLTERSANGAKNITKTSRVKPVMADPLPGWRSPTQRALIVALRERYESDERVRG
jgi:hypothetical protein